jgi:hypothetical protein
LKRLEVAVDVRDERQFSWKMKLVGVAHGAAAPELAGCSGREPIQEVVHAPSTHSLYPNAVRIDVDDDTLGLISKQLACPSRAAAELESSSGPAGANSRHSFIQSPSTKGPFASATSAICQ